MSSIVCRFKSFQSTHLHEVWLISLRRYGSCEVSIHTPTWGVTSASISWPFFKVFQSTHLHEVWRKVGKIPLIVFSFNPHTYMRCDPIDLHIRRIRTSFNPHTYMRCDQLKRLLDVERLSFNPHTYMRCDQRRWTNWFARIRFQSTHLHEVWPRLQDIKIKIYLCFNPHTSMRCDPYAG